MTNNINNQVGDAQFIKCTFLYIDPSNNIFLTPFQYFQATFENLVFRYKIFKLGGLSQ